MSSQSEIASPISSRQGALVDLPGQLIELATSAGLQVAARQAALLTALRDGELVARSSFFQLCHARKGAIPRMLLIAHEDVLVFTKPAPR